MGMTYATWDESDEDVDGGEPKALLRRRKQRRATIDILAADNDIVALAKPAFLPVDDADDAPDHVLRQLTERFGGGRDAFTIVERMDADISGVMVVARSAAARRELPHAFGRSQVVRTYAAIVRAARLDPAGTITVDIGPDTRGGPAMRVGGSQARPAVTEWSLKDQYAGFALLECRTTHERMHQVRLHLQAMGMPLAVDPMYGGHTALLLSSFKPDYRASRRHEERPLIARVSLHAATMSLAHPVSAEPRRFEALLPRDFRAALNQLDKHGRIGIGQRGQDARPESSPEP